MALEPFHLAGNNSELTQTKSQGESPVCWLGCSPGREAPGSQIRVRAAKWNSINWEGLERLHAARLGGSSCVGGKKSLPLGEGREFNSGLLKSKGSSYCYLIIMGMGWLFFSRWVLWRTFDLVFLKVMKNQYFFLIHWHILQRTEQNSDC